MLKKAFLSILVIGILFSSCKQNTKQIPTVGFLDFIEDATLAQAKTGFIDALKKNGYSQTDNTVKIIYRNAQGNQPTLIQSCDYFISEKVDLIAANTTLSTITAVQKSKTIPVCMMVAPRPDLAKLTDYKGNAPANLFGTYEILTYIDTSVSLIKTVFPNAKKIGTIYNQAEPQSVDAFNRIKSQCAAMRLELISLPVNNSSETQVATESLLSKGIDAFFARNLKCLYLLAKQAS
jgi:putative ABC transport system substrate-binding protein